MGTRTCLYRWLLILLLFSLVGCKNQSVALPTDTAISPTPSYIPIPSATATSSATIITTSLPAIPVLPFYTPNPKQVEKWREYEQALARAFFPSTFSDKMMCEWEILGQSNQEVYVWARCEDPIYSQSAEIPAVILLRGDGSVEGAKRPGAGYISEIQEMFPPEVQARIFGDLIHFQELRDHLNWRKEHPEDPPYIVLSATQMP